MLPPEQTQIYGISRLLQGEFTTLTRILWN